MSEPKTPSAPDKTTERPYLEDYPPEVQEEALCAYASEQDYIRQSFSEIRPRVVGGFEKKDDPPDDIPF